MADERIVLTASDINRDIFRGHGLLIREEGPNKRIVIYRDERNQCDKLVISAGKFPGDFDVAYPELRELIHHSRYSMTVKS